MSHPRPAFLIPTFRNGICKMAAQQKKRHIYATQYFSFPLFLLSWIGNQNTEHAEAYEYDERERNSALRTQSSPSSSPVSSFNPFLVYIRFLFSRFLFRILPMTVSTRKHRIEGLGANELGSGADSGHTSGYTLEGQEDFPPKNLHRLAFSVGAYQHTPPLRNSAPPPPTTPPPPLFLTLATLKIFWGHISRDHKLQSIPGNKGRREARLGGDGGFGRGT